MEKTAVTIEMSRQPAYAVATVAGPAEVSDFASAITALAAYAREHGRHRAIANCLGVTVKHGLSEHYTIGQLMGRELRHLKRVATVLPESMITRASEKVAASAGLQVRVFSDLDEAVAWLVS